LSLRVTDERVKDHKMFKELIEDALEKYNVYRVLADKGYDTRDNFNYLDERKIDPGIRVRKNASKKSRGSPSRKKAVIEQDKYDKWRRDKGYGYRWLVESAFSSIKRTIGEHISSKKMDRIIDEVAWKTQLYNKYIQLLPKTKESKIIQHSKKKVM